MTESTYTAVALIAPLVPPYYKACPRCYQKLQYWRTGRGNQWLCSNCHRVIE